MRGHWFFCKEKVDKILKYTLKGEPLEDAADLAGVNPKTVKSWIEYGSIELEEYERHGPEHQKLSPYGEFYQQMRWARAVRRSQDRKYLRNLGRKHPELWRAFVRVLEQTDPEAWGKRVAIRQETELTIVMKEVSGDEWQGSIGGSRRDEGDVIIEAQYSPDEMHSTSTSDEGEDV